MHSSQPGSSASGAASVDSFHTARSELLSAQVRSSPSGSRSAGVHGDYAAQLAPLHDADAGPAPGGWPSGSRGYLPASAPGSQHSQPYSSKHSSRHSSSSHMEAEGHPHHGSGHHPAQYPPGVNGGAAGGAQYPGQGPGAQLRSAVPRKVTGGGGGPVAGSSGAEWLVQLEALMSDLAGHPYKCQACQSPSWKMVTSEVRRLVQAMQVGCCGVRPAVLLWCRCLRGLWPWLVQLYSAPIRLQGEACATDWSRQHAGICRWSRVMVSCTLACRYLA